MSLRRRDLRQAVVGILSNFGQAPFPTLARQNVFDTKSTSISMHSGDDQIPTILVYTDTEKREPVSNMMSWPMEPTVQLVIEITVANNNADNQTDAALEAVLDELEEQVVNTLFDVRQKGSKAAEFSQMYTKLKGYDSIRMGNSESNNRMAMRGIVVDICYNQNPKTCPPVSELFPELKTISAYADYGDADNSVSTQDDLSAQ